MKKSTKKVFAAFMAAALCVAGLAGCGTKDGSSSGNGGSSFNYNPAAQKKEKKSCLT